jgi:hypothetical protein
MSQIIINIGDAPDDGDGTQLRQAFADINTMMSEIYAAGPVDSQVVITNNSITTNVTNANLILAPSGIGVVRVTNHLLPNVDDVYDLGSYYPELLRWNSLWIGSGGINSSGSMTVDGNLTVGGVISGDGSGLTNVVANVGSAIKIQNGNTELGIPSANGNIVANIGGITDVLTIYSGGLDVTANIAAANIIAGDFYFSNGQSIIDSISSNTITNGNTDFGIATANGNIVANVGGVTDVLVISPNGIDVTANVTAGNIISDNFFFGNGQSIFDNVVSNISVGANVGLDYTANTLNTIYNTTIGDSVESVSVGGATPLPASTWKTKNLVQVLDAILFPDLDPTYTVPTLTLSGNQSGTKEIGSTINQALATIGTENDAGIFTVLNLFRQSTQIFTVNNPTGTLTANIEPQFGYADPNNPNFTYQLSNTDSYTVTSGTTSWSATGNYNAGLPKLDNKGVTDSRTAAVRSINAPQAAAGITSSSISINGIYPYFWGKSVTQPTANSIAIEIAGGTANKVLAVASETVSVTYNADGEYVWLAVQSAYTQKTVWYFTELNQGLIGPGNFILSPVTQNVNSPNGFWNGISYKIYISDGATITEGALQYRNS